jgi:tripartite motif-containing protein 71
MAIDPTGRLWVADTGNSRFAIFEPDGTFVEYWEHRGTGVGEFILERSNGDGFGAIAFAPDGSFYVLDVGNHRIEHFDKERHFIKAWGSFGSDPGQFIDPIGMVVDSSGVIYVLDDKRDVVERYDTNGTVLGSITAYPGAPFGYDSGGTFAVDSVGNVYTSTWRVGARVKKIDPNGAVLISFGSKGTGLAQFPDQPGPAVLDADGRLFVGGGPLGSVLIFGAGGTFMASFTSPGLSHAENAFVTGIVLDGNGSGYVSEAGSNLVEKFRLLAPFAPSQTASPTS